MRFTVEYLFMLRDRFSGPAARVGAAAAAAKKNIHGMGAAATTAGGELAILAGALGFLTAKGMVGAIKNAAKFEAELANVRKVTGITRKEMLKYGDALLDISTRVAVDPNKLAQIMAAGGRMGIRGEKALSQFAETVAKVAVAWDGVSEAIVGSQLARLGDKFFAHMTQEGKQKAILDTADAITNWGNRAAFAHPELLKFFDNASAGSKVFGLTAKQAAAYGGAALVADQPSGQLQGTRAQMTFVRLLRAAMSANKKQRAGLKKIGLTPKALETMIKTDAQDALLNVMGRLEKIAGPDRFKLIGDILSDQRSARQLNAIVNSLNEYKRQLTIVDDKYARLFSQDKKFMTWMRKAFPQQAKLLEDTRRAIHRGSVENEFRRRSETLEFAGRRIARVWNRLRTIVAMPLLEPLTKQFHNFADALNSLGNFAQANPDLANSFSFGVLGASIAAMTVGALELIKYLTGVQSKLAIIRGLAVISLKIVGVAAALAALHHLYTNWSKIRDHLNQPIEVKINFPKLPAWLNTLMTKGVQGLLALPSVAMAAKDSVAGTKRAATVLGPTVPAQGNRFNFTGGKAANPPVRVHSTVKVTAPNSITLNLPNGAVAGTVPLSATATQPKGTATAPPPAAPAQ